MKCKNCNKLIEQIKGKKARFFCSDKCRMAYNRTIKSEHSKANKSNPNKSEQANPNKSEQVKNIAFLDARKNRIPTIPPTGFCQVCNRKITEIKEQWVNGIANEELAMLIRVCLPCVNQRLKEELPEIQPKTP